MAIIGALPFDLQNGTTADATQVMADFNEIVNDTNANAATAGANSNITSLSGLTTPLSVVQGGSGSQTPSPFTFTGGYRNIIRRNGGLEIWQRGAGGTALFTVPAGPGTMYTADGWYLFTNANQGSTVTQAPGIALGSVYSAKPQRTSGQTGTAAMLFGFPLGTDELYTALGQYVRVSLNLQAGTSWSPASGNITIGVIGGTGTPVKFASGYTGSAGIISVVQPITTTTTRYQFTSPAIVPTNVRQMEVFLEWTPVGTAGVDDSFYVDNVQLEVVPASSGYTASNFERLLVEESLLLCQRHFQKTFAYNVAPAQNVGVDTGELLGIAGKAGAATDLLTYRWPVTMRVVPSGTFYNPAAANGEVRDETAGADCSATASLLGTERLKVITTGNGATAVGNIIGIHAIADAGI